MNRNNLPALCITLLKQGYNARLLGRAGIYSNFCLNKSSEIHSMDNGSLFQIWYSRSYLLTLKTESISSLFLMSERFNCCAVIS
ncbi:MAG: hypothetical protein ACMG51_00315 [Ginsengibacter sp.]